MIRHNAETRNSVVFILANKLPSPFHFLSLITFSSFVNRPVQVNKSSKSHHFHNQFNMKFVNMILTTQSVNGIRCF